jgi:hypothetical protein
MYRKVVTICIAHWSLYVPHGGHYMYRTVVIIRTTSLIFNNSTFCPHTVFMCFVWISEQTAIISLYNINWLVCITQTECVYCAVRTGYLYIIQVILRVKEQNTQEYILSLTAYEHIAQYADGGGAGVLKQLTEETKREGEKRNKERVGNSENVTALKSTSSVLSSFG